MAFELTNDVLYILVAVLLSGLLIFGLFVTCCLCVRQWNRETEHIRRRQLRKKKHHPPPGATNGKPPQMVPNGHPPATTVPEPVPKDVLQGERTHVFVNPARRPRRTSSLPTFIVTPKMRRFSMFKKKEPRPVSWLDYNKQPVPIGCIEKGAGFYSSEYTVMDRSIAPLHVPIIANTNPDNPDRLCAIPPPASQPIVTVSAPHVHRADDHVTEHPMPSHVRIDRPRSGVSQTSGGGLDNAAFAHDMMMKEKYREDPMFVSSVTV